jgi:hypothetical protein
MATSVNINKYAPKPTGVRDPRDSNKKNGMFRNWPRYLYLGGGSAAGFSQAGSRKPRAIGQSGPDQDAVGPISDRGRGRG